MSWNGKVMELLKTFFYWCVVGSKKRLPIKLIALAMIGGGSWNFNWSDNTGNSFSFSMDNGNGILSMVLVVIGLIILIREYINESKNKAIIIQHTGIAEIPTIDIASARPIWEQVFRPTTINIECERFYKNGIVTDPQSMLEQTKNIKQTLENNTRKINAEYLKLYYGGLIQVPFAFLAGVIFDNTKPVEIYDWDRDANKWYSIKNFKTSVITINIEPPKHKVTNKIAIEVAISYEINRENTLDAVGNIPVLKITSDPIKIDGVKDLKSQQYVAKEFHKILDKYADLDEIHIFLAAQNSMVFNLGRQVSQRVHPKILVWQYENLNNLKNPWAIEISDKFSIKKPQ